MVLLGGLGIAALLGYAWLTQKGEKVAETGETAFGGTGFTTGNVFSDLASSGRGQTNEGLYSQMLSAIRALKPASQTIRMDEPEKVVSVSTAPSLTSYSGAYIGTTYTSPQGYKMSVSPSNVGALASSFAPTPRVQTAQQKAYSILTAPTTQAKVAAGLGVSTSVINPSVNTTPKASGGFNYATSSTGKIIGGPFNTLAQARAFEAKFR